MPLVIGNQPFFGDNETTIGLFAEKRSGLPYSYVYSSGNLFGDPIGRTRAPIYVPTGPGDPIVSGVGDINGNGIANEQNDFTALTENLSALGLGSGIQARNSQKAPDVVRVDLRFTQEIPFVKGHKIKLFVDIENFANLLNDDWGVPKEFVSDFSDIQVPLIDADLLPDGTYRYNAILNPQPTVLTAESFWRIQLGFNYRF